MRFILVFAALCSASPAWAARVFEPTPMDSKKYFESFTVLAVLNDGTYVQGLLAISNIGLGTGNGACRLLLVRPQHEPQVVAASVKRDDWHFSGDPEPTLKMGPCRVVAAADEVRVDVFIDGTALRLALRKPATQVSLPDTRISTGDTLFEQQVFVPFAPAQVTLSTGGRTETLAGFGYADHSRSAALPLDVARGWVRFRGFGPGCSTLLAARFPPAEGAAPKGYIWRERDDGPKSLAGWQVALPAAGLPADGLRLTVSDPNGTTLTLKAKRQLIRHAPMEAYGLLGKLVRPWLGTILNETFEASLDDGAACRNIPGVMELDHNTR